MDISLRKNFHFFINKSTLYLWDLVGDKIRLSKAEEVSGEIEYQNYKDHMKTLRKDILPSPNKMKNLVFQSFHSTVDSLQRIQTLKKLFCRYNEFYLVKRYFTEGVQYVKQGEIHTYKAIGRPLDIFVSNVPLESHTFRNSYDRCTKPERISPGETKILPSNTYYIVIAPCHTFFMKKITKTESENSTKTTSLLANETDQHVTRNLSSELDRVSYQPSGSRDEEHRNSRSRDEGHGNSRSRDEEHGNSRSRDEEHGKSRSRDEEHGNSRSRDEEHGNSRRSSELETFVEVNDRASTSSKRSSTGKDHRQLKRAKSSTPRPTASTALMEEDLNPPSPNSLRNEMVLFSKVDTNNDGHGRAVFAIRKDSNIESYALRSGSTFRILQDNIMTGSFTIENDDMDPCVIEYYGEVQFIREIATFKNGSTFETTLTVQKDLLNELSDSTRKKEKIVVNYFFEFAFKSIEAAYKKFLEMKNMKMIGSCVPAIVPLSDGRYFGPVSDAYEAKP